jgi:RNA polymerase sigma-70 factor (ECF subfamily)
VNSPEEVSRLLAECSYGNQAAFNKLLPLVYDELHRLASAYMSRERRDHTLQTTALVNEAYLRLVDQNRARWQDRVHFLAIASKVMRQILIDHARTHGRAKRGGGEQRISLDEVAVVSEQRSAELLALDEALRKLAEVDRRKSDVVELRFFGGLTIEEAAEVLKVTPKTVTRDWNMARAWLLREISRGGNHASR